MVLLYSGSLNVNNGIVLDTAVFYVYSPYEIYDVNEESA